MTPPQRTGRRRGPRRADIGPWLLHACAVAYASDVLLLSTTLAPHATMIGAPGISAASLDHAVWFHRPVRADRWPFYDQESPWAGAARRPSRQRGQDPLAPLRTAGLGEGLLSALHERAVTREEPRLP